ncbi:MAG: hypothetical protein HY962_07150 [Ignavibacteriae bacterium]|nr:hypothetical protein [Ignavibacteriota bacterium]
MPCLPRITASCRGAFQVVLYFAIWQVAGARALAATALVWWTGGCDLLYYFLGRYPLWTKSWTWLWWTPGGLLALAGASGNRDRMWYPLWAVIVQSAAGLGLAAWIIWR